MHESRGLGDVYKRQVIAMRLSARKKAQKAAQEKAEKMAELAEYAQAANKAKTAFKGRCMI